MTQEAYSKQILCPCCNKSYIVKCVHAQIEKKDLSHVEFITNEPCDLKVIYREFEVF